MDCSCCDRRLAADPCDCEALYCRRCRRCARHCRCTDPRLVGADEGGGQAEADEPVVVAALERHGFSSAGGGPGSSVS